MAATRTGILAGRHPSSPRWLGILAKVLVLVVIMAGTFFTLSCLRDTTPVASPDESVAQINAPPAVEETKPQIQEPVVEEITIQVKEPVITAVVPETELVLPEEISPPAQFEQMRVKWVLADEGIDIPPRGNEPLSGTIVAQGIPGMSMATNTPSREAWFTKNLPEIDLSGTIVAIAEDKDTFFVVVNDCFTDTQRLFLSRDGGSTWFEPNLPEGWNYHILSEIRVVEDNGSSTLLLSYSGRTWWTATVD